MALSFFFLMDNFQLESESETGQWKEGYESKRRYTCVPGQNQNGLRFTVEYAVEVAQICRW
jgi:hypothetical protein